MTKKEINESEGKNGQVGGRRKKERIKRRGSEERQEKDHFFLKKGASESNVVRQALYNKGKRQEIIYELLHSIILFILATVYIPNEAYCSFRFCYSFCFFFFSLCDRFNYSSFFLL